MTKNSYRIRKMEFVKKKFYQIRIVTNTMIIIIQPKKFEFVISKWFNTTFDYCIQTSENYIDKFKIKNTRTDVDRESFPHPRDYESNRKNYVSF
jgi:hypothetical protein